MGTPSFAERVTLLHPFRIYCCFRWNTRSDSSSSLLHPFRRPLLSAPIFNHAKLLRFLAIELALPPPSAPRIPSLPLGLSLWPGCTPSASPRWMPSASRSGAPHAAASPSAGAATSVPSAAAPRRETDPKKRVATTVVGLVSVFGNDVDAHYEKLLDGEGGIGNIDRFDASKFPTKFAGQIRGFSSEGYIDEKNDRLLDDYLRYCLVGSETALESAGLGVGSEAHGQVCLFSHFTIK
ncbi:hypothetical protein BHM03_00058227 [Ensete ventricosum]|uniref:beta-ketoacyl-[acyl-carrier-protein] synthase I n=1 Tax=Ensete ventricosum TaxID=4639 RepID=A0A445MMK3_ENSVE|nr:hypothetical protein BHM03_00058227 [Ensete ventricosum]